MRLKLKNKNFYSSDGGRGKVNVVMIKKCLQ